jgi:hypothetical protein
MAHPRMHHVRSIVRHHRAAHQVVGALPDEGGGEVAND